MKLIATILLLFTFLQPTSGYEPNCRITQWQDDAQEDLKETIVNQEKFLGTNSSGYRSYNVKSEGKDSSFNFVKPFGRNDYVISSIQVYKTDKRIGSLNFSEVGLNTETTYADFRLDSENTSIKCF